MKANATDFLTGELGIIISAGLDEPVAFSRK